MKSKFYFILIMLVLALSLFPSLTFAKTATIKTAVTQAQNQQLENLRTRGINEINRRLTSLDKLTTIVDNMKRLSASQKSDLKAQIQSQINDLTVLKTKIQGDTDLTTLRADVKSIVNSYRIFLLYIPKIHLLAGADAMLNLSDKLTSLAAKLAVRIAQAKSQGQDTTTIEQTLADMNAKIADALKQYQSIESTIMPLVPQDYPNNKSTLQQGRVMLQTGRQDLVTARNDAQSIINTLKTFDTATATTASSPTP